RRETEWRQVAVIATSMRDLDSKWPAPFWRGTCITWTSSVVAVGWDFAERVLREQRAAPASRDRPVEVAGGRLRTVERRLEAGAPCFPSDSEIMAHEIGHTWQARWLSLLHLPTGAVFTLWREGEGWLHWYENQASAEGQFGGIVDGSVHPGLMKRAARN
ncbi:MAG: hypothetical protein K2W96_23455, partial [Gemmataceae bacterium]|nr:hypothetical protein [Gemmataceae bacterium]